MSGSIHDLKYSVLQALYGSASLDDLIYIHSITAPVSTNYIENRMGVTFAYLAANYPDMSVDDALYQFYLDGAAILPTGKRFYLRFSNPTNATVGDGEGTAIIEEAAPVPAKQFFLRFSNPINATVGDGEGVGTIDSSSITPSVAVNRTSGVAPLLVHFDASATTAASLTSHPFHDLEYDWNFGDSGSGSWGYGARAQFSISTLRNVDRGPIAGHVFDTPGTYTVTLGVRHDGVSATPVTTTITVTDPDVVFSGTNTVCIANGTLPVAGVNGVPTGAVCVNTSSIATINGYIATGKRVLLKRGDSWTTATNLQINAQGPGHVGAYGTGARPLITATAAIACIKVSDYAAAGLSDWRVCDIECNGGDFATAGDCVLVDGPINNLLIKNMRVTKAKYGIHSTNNHPTALICDVMGIVDCDVAEGSGVYPTATGGNGVYVGAERLIMLGNNVNPNGLGEHGIRTFYSNRAVYAHNSIQDVVATKAHLSVRAPLLDSEPLGNMAYLADGGYLYAEKIVMRDNYLKQTDGSITSIGAGPVNADHGAGRVRNVIIENNYGLSMQIGIYGSQYTSRNNICTPPPGGERVMHSMTHLALQPDPIDVWLYNNSCFSSSADDVYLLFVNGAPMPGSTVTARNNLFYASTSGQDPDTLIYIGTTPSLDPTLVVTESNNTSVVQTDPDFTTTPPTTPAHYKPVTGSYAIAGGTSVPVWSDFFDVEVTGASRTLGAIKE